MDRGRQPGYSKDRMRETRENHKEVLERLAKSIHEVQRQLPKANNIVDWDKMSHSQKRLWIHDARIFLAEMLENGLKLELNGTEE